MEKIGIRRPSPTEPSLKKPQRHSVSRTSSKSNMAAMNNALSQYKLLKAEWTKKSPNLEKCRELLDNLKVSQILRISNFALGNDFALFRDITLL